MSNEQIKALFNLRYGYFDAYFFEEAETVAQARSMFNTLFTNFISFKQPIINNYYDGLFNKISNYIDSLEVTKEGSTILEKHKGRKESTNKDVTTGINEDTTKATNTDFYTKEKSDYDDTTTHGKTVADVGNEKVLEKRVYFGSNNLVDTKETDTTPLSSSAHNTTSESGTTKVAHQGAEADNFTHKVGDEDDNYERTTKDENSNFNHVVADAINNYRTIEDISDSIFDKDVMDYNDYKSNTRNSINELNNLWKLNEELKDKTLVEMIFTEFFNHVTFCCE